MITDSSKWLPAAGVAIVILLIIVPSAMLMRNSSPEDTPVTREEAIFNEATAQLGVSGDSVTYFRIFGDDRVVYGTGRGINYAYKMNGEWHLAGPADQQEAPDCTLVENVPEQYRPPCFDSVNNRDMYTTASSTATNYPLSEMSTYK